MANLLRRRELGRNINIMQQIFYLNLGAEIY